MSISGYLDKLDYEQLRNARNIADRLIKKKDNEPKIPLWVVSDDYINYAAFTVDNYQDAVARMCDEVKKAGNNKSGMPIEMNLDKIHVRESEVSNYLELD